MSAPAAVSRVAALASRTVSPIASASTSAAQLAHPSATAAAAPRSFMSSAPTAASRPPAPTTTTARLTMPRGSFKRSCYNPSAASAFCTF